MRIALLNDTADWYHWGCTATSRAMAEQLGQMTETLRTLPISRTYNLNEVPEDIRHFLNGSITPAFERANPDVIELLDASDMVVVNGEGTLHGVRKASYNLLYLMLAARQTLNKRVFVINHSLYPRSMSHKIAPLRRLAEQAAAGATMVAMPNFLKLLPLEFYRRAYNQIDGAAIRDKMSFKIASDLRVQTRIVQSFDCLPLSVSKTIRASAREQKDERRIVLAARSNMPMSYAEAMAKISRRLQAAGFSLEVIAGAKAAACTDESVLQSALQKQGVNVSLYTASSLDDWLIRIGSAGALISGRFHHTIAASMLEVPVIMLDAATPKLQSIAHMLSLPQPRDHSYYLDDSNAKNVLTDIERSPTISDALRRETVTAAMENFRILT